MDKHFTVLNSQIRFDGNCEKTRPFCGAVCCKNTTVLLTTEEKESGKYEYKEPTEGCNCAGCQLMRQQDKVSLRRNKDGCYLLDGENKCSLHQSDTKPEVCKNFKCESVFWNLSLSPNK